MNFHGLSDDEIFAKVADAEPAVRVDALMYMGMRRSADKTDEAIGFYQNAFELADANGLREHRSHASRYLAQALYMSKRNAEAKVVIETELARESLVDISDLSFGIMLGQYAVLQAEEGLVEEAIASLEEASNMLSGEDDKLFLPTFYCKVSSIFNAQAKYQLAANIGQKARSLALETENTQELGMALYFLGRAYEGMWMLVDSMKCYKEAFILLDHQSDGDWELHTKLAIGRLHWLNGDNDLALEELHPLRGVAKSVPWADEDLPARVDLQIARCLLENGEFEAAATKYFQARTLLRGQGNHRWAAVAEVEGAYVQLLLGNTDDAVQAAENGMRWFNEKPAPGALDFWIRLAYAKVMNQTSNYSATYNALDCDISEEIGFNFAPHVEYLVEQAVAESNVGEHFDAAERAASLLANAETLLGHNNRGRLQVVLAEEAFSRNDFSEALRFLALAVQSHSHACNHPVVLRIGERIQQVVAHAAANAHNAKTAGTAWFNTPESEVVAPVLEFKPAGENQ